MTQAAASVRLLRLEEWRDHLHELEHEKRIRALELGWAKLAGGAIVGSTIGGAIVAYFTR